MASTKHLSQPCTIALVPLGVQQWALQDSHERGTLHAPLHSFDNWLRLHFHVHLKAPLHTYMAFPHPSDTEAYDNALPPKLGDHHHLTTYSDACWGSQIGNAIPEGIQLPLFKFHSMSGAILFSSGGLLTWKADWQERTLLSSCKAKIWATYIGSRLTINTCNMILHLSACGYPIDDTSSPTPIYNNNEACIKWCNNMTSKGNHHIELQENITGKWVNKGAITVSQVSGKSNLADIFTKEMKDRDNFCRLRDSFMCWGSDSLKGLYTSTLPILDAMASDPFHIAQSVHYVPPSAPGTLEVLLSYALFRTPAALSCLSHTGRHILLHISLLCRFLWAIAWGVL